MIVIYHFEAKNSKKIFGPNATSGECTKQKQAEMLKSRSNKDEMDDDEKDGCDGVCDIAWCCVIVW